MKQRKQQLKQKENKTMENKNLTVAINNNSADFIPTSLNDLTKEFMINYICEKAPTEKKWFKELVTKKNTIKRKKKGSSEIIEIEQVTSFATIRTEFANKFFPEIIKPKNVTLADMVANW